MRPLTLSILALFLFCGFFPVDGQGQDTASIQLPPREQFRIVLLVGQSNMAGRGFVEAEDKVPIPRVYMLDPSGQWVPAVDPVHYDKKSAGVGPGRAFAKELVKADPSIAVGLVPAACGGSSVDHWEPGVYFEQTKSRPYDDAVSRTKRALQDGVLEAILWRQGESDATPRAVPQHAEKLTRLFKRFRDEFDAPEIPILVGELYFDKETEWTKAIRDAQITVVDRVQPSAFVSSEGTTLNPDRVHFDRASQLEQGKRFYEAFRRLKDAQK